MNLALMLAILCSMAQAPGKTKIKSSTAAAVRSVRIIPPAGAGSIARRASELLAREITERSGAGIVRDKAGLTVELLIRPGIGTEGYTIEGTAAAVRITGNDDNGLLYGVGKFLHTSRYDQGGFTPGGWRGTSVPTGEVRGIYFATHFGNFYQGATVDEVQRYVDDMALWGTNTLGAWFQLDEFKGLDDPRLHQNLVLLKELFKTAKKDGIRIALLSVWNIGFPDAPREIRAVDGSSHHAGFGGSILICPNRGHEYLQKLNNWILGQFSDIGIDYIVHWPYDPGGCDCNQCAPWGANGYLSLSREVTEFARQKYPRCKSILSTWCYDYGPVWGVEEKNKTEWKGLSAALAKDKSWVDYIMADAHGDFPPYPLMQGVPGNLPMINFPEISMIGQFSWGAYGANPLPGRFQRLWNQAKGRLEGGLPYSEGIFEDINKIICSQFYWNAGQSAEQTVKEYIAFNYSPAVTDAVYKAITIFEHNHFRKMVVENKRMLPGRSDLPDAGYQRAMFVGGSRIEFKNPDSTALSAAQYRQLESSTGQALRLLQQAEKKLPAIVRSGWRWRILYLRAVIDHELVKTKGWFEGPVLKAAFQELTGIYHTQNALLVVHVPGIDDPAARYSDKELIALSNWKFKTGDNLRWAEPAFDDAGWKAIEAGSHWEEQGYAGYNGYAWYRIKFSLPSALKQKIRTGRLCISLGRIDDHDQSFLNGQFLGQNAKLFPAHTTRIEDLSKTPMAWDVDREYTIPLDDPRLRWDQDNVIAIRVYDEIYNGGLYKGLVNISIGKKE